MHAGGGDQVLHVRLAADPTYVEGVIVVEEINLGIGVGGPAEVGPELAETGRRRPLVPDVFPHAVYDGRRLDAGRTRDPLAREGGRRND